MTTLFVGTNRVGSNSQLVAEFYSKRLKLHNITHQLFNLRDMPQDLLTNEMYHTNSNNAMVTIQESILKPTQKYIFIIPEYNGSIPGTLKAFIDASDIPACFYGKKACLIGVAAGRAGNLRGMDHFTNILNHIKIDVHHLKIPISAVENHLNDHNEIITEEIINLIDQQILEFQKF